VYADKNEAESVNGLSVDLLSYGDERARVEDRVLDAVRGCDAVVAHGAAFDKQWVSLPAELPWVCSCDDIEWPRKSSSRSLAAIALAHGVGVLDAHRAGADVATMVRLFERVHDMGTDLASMLALAMRPKALFAVADRGFDAARNQKAKELGFRWNAEAKRWERRMTAEQSASMPFAVTEVEAGAT
jgi:DNA polymerase III epsilon subunit-like protein